MKINKFAFIGRSNVGKSSLINQLIGKGELAKTSKNPGKTRKISEYELNEKIILVDLPGYGYAKVKEKTRENWDSAFLNLIFQDPDFHSIFCLIDSSIKPMKNDIEFLIWLEVRKVQKQIVFTKSDKIKAKELNENLKLWTDLIQIHNLNLNQIFHSSLKNKTGFGEILHFLKKQ